MKTVAFEFHDELNDFLHPSKKARGFDYLFKDNPSVKHLIEAVRVPHTEVHEIIVNGDHVSLSYQVKDGDSIHVYPYPKSKLGQLFYSGETDKGGRPRFLLDNHLGKLAIYLRMLGFDSMYENDYNDDEISNMVAQDNRVLLSRDRGLLMRRVITQGYCVRSLDPDEQVIEVIQRFDLKDQLQPFHRCLRCNSVLEEIAKELIEFRLMPLTRKYYNEFRICNSCDQIFWKGSHYGRMVEFIERIKATLAMLN